MGGEGCKKKDADKQKGKRFLHEVNQHTDLLV